MSHSQNFWAGNNTLPSGLTVEQLNEESTTYIIVIYYVFYLIFSLCSLVFFFRAKKKELVTHIKHNGLLTA